MLKRLFIVFPLLIILGHVATSAESSLYSELINLAEIEFQVVEHTSSNIHYIWLHGDEKTARLLLNEHIKTQPGKAFLINQLGLALCPRKRFFARRSKSPFGGQKSPFPLGL